MGWVCVGRGSNQSTHCVLCEDIDRQNANGKNEKDDRKRHDLQNGKRVERRLRLSLKDRSGDRNDPSTATPGKLREDQNWLVIFSSSLLKLET